MTRSFDVSLICAWINSWVNNRYAGDLRRHRANYDVIVMRVRPAQSYRLSNIGPTDGENLHMEMSMMNLNWEKSSYTLQWRHYERDGVSTHRRLDCFFNRLFSHRPTKTSMLRLTGFCEANSLVTGEFPTQRASNMENISILRRHHEIVMHNYRRKTVRNILIITRVNLAPDLAASYLRKKMRLSNLVPTLYRSILSQLMQSLD